MERISDRYDLSVYQLNEPLNCYYYAGGSCLGQKYAPVCTGPNCDIFKSKVQIITLCGSTRFKKQFFEALHDLTLQGYIVLMPGIFGHSDEEPTEEQKKNLDELHLEKIRLSNAIFVLNIGGYIGQSTKREIEFAKSLNIPIYMYER